MMVNRALDAVMPAYRQVFARYQLTEQQWRVLRVIWTSDNTTSARLSERTLLSAPSLVNIIDRRRVRSAEDRRQYYVVATEAGRQLQLEVTPQVVAIQDQIQASVTQKEWDALGDILQKITKSMTEKDALADEVVPAKAS